MSGGGDSKGGKTTQSIDPRLSAASAEALTRAGQASKIPYSPNRGVTIAAFTPQQEASMRNASNAAEAFGLEGGDAATMPTAETSASGIKGYSTGAEYDDMINKSLSPELQAAINKMFISRTGGSTGSGGAAKSSTGSGNTLGMLLGNTMGLNKKGQTKKDYFNFGEGK